MAADHAAGAGQEDLLAGEIAVTQAATAPPVAYRTAAAPAAQAAPATDGAITISNGPPLTNPSLHLDLALNLVVLQFFNAQGQVTQSIPSQKQLDAYRLQSEPATAPPEPGPAASV